MMKERKERNYEIRDHPSDKHIVFVHHDGDPEKITVASEGIKLSFTKYKINFVEWEDGENEVRLHRAIDMMMAERRQTHYEIRHHPDDNHKVYVYHRDDPEKINVATEEIKLSFRKYEINFVEWEDDESEEKLLMAIDSKGLDRLAVEGGSRKNLRKAITSMMEERKQKNYEIRHHRRDRLKVSVYHGDNRQEIEKAAEPIRNDFPSYTLKFYHSKLADRGFTVLLNDYDYNYSIPLMLEDRRTCKKSTVDLLLMIKKPTEKAPALHAATVAHVALFDREIDPLLCGACDNYTIAQCRKDLADWAYLPEDDSAGPKWSITDHHTGFVTESSGVPSISFQKKRKNSDFQVARPEDLLRDVALFPLSENQSIHEFIHNNAPSPPKSCIYVSGESFGRQPPGPVRSHIKGMLSVSELSLSALCKILQPQDKAGEIKVVIGDTVGCIADIIPECDVDESSSDCIRFLIETAKRLHPGRSGSIVYVIKRGTSDLYVLGMLHAAKERDPTDDDSALDECFLIQPAIKQTLIENMMSPETSFWIAGCDEKCIDIQDFDFARCDC